MNVIRAGVMGMCFGVRDALRRIDAVANPAEVTIHGELVHNERVTESLKERGFASSGEVRRDRGDLPLTPIVLITAHGVSDRERQRLAEGGKTLIDTTCPLVNRAHQAAKRLADEGYHVLVIGKRGHVEVLGLVGDLPQFDIIETLSDVRKYPSQRLGVISQTTFPVREVERIHSAIRFENAGAEVRVVDTVCLPTKDHQRSLEALLTRDDVEAIVVVGGRHSNNTRELTKLCRERGKVAFQVASAGDLTSSWFDGMSTVGLTAGTSTLDVTIDEVETVLRRLPILEAAATEITSASEGLPLLEWTMPWDRLAGDRA